jgi:hypothetical protein
MANVETIISELAPLRLIGTAAFTMQGLSPMYAAIKRTSRPVRGLNLAQTSTAQQWVFHKTLGLGMGGAMRHVPTAGPTIATAAQPLIVLNEAQTYPAALEATIPGYDRMTGVLSKIRGNIVMDEAVLQQNQADGLASDVFDDTMEGVALRLDLHKLASFFSPSSTYRHIGTISSTITIDAGSNTANFVPGEGNEVLYHEGHMLNFLDTSDPMNNRAFQAGAAASNDDLSTQIMVTGVDPITRTVYIADLSQQGALANLADGDRIAHQGQLVPSVATGGGTGYGAYCLADWLVNSGNVLDVPTSTFHRLKSIITTNVGAPWTEDQASRHLMWYDRWHGRRPITDLYFTPGGLEAHRKTMLGIFQADRTGVPAKVVGGFTADTHVHNGKRVNYWADPFMRADTTSGGSWVIGIHQGPGNLAELHPPAAPGRSGGRFGGDVRFKVQGPSIFQIVGFSPANAGPIQTTTIREAPFDLEYNLWPLTHLPGVMAGGVTESNWS